MTIELEYDPERAYGPDGERWFFGDLLGADSGLALTSMLLGGDIVGPVQVISAVEVAENDRPAGCVCYSPTVKYNPICDEFTPHNVWLYCTYCKHDEACHNEVTT